MDIVTACTMDCPDSCSLIVTKEADGSLRIRGNPSHPFTRGFTCGKIKKHAERLNSPSRQTHPLKKNKGGWKKIGWDEALDLCAHKIDCYKGETGSILHIHGEGAKGVVKQVGKLFFALIGAARLKGSLCDAAGIVACYKDFGSIKNHDPADLLNSRKIVIWGKDLSRSSIHMADIVKKGRQRGASVLTVSPEGGHNKSFSDDRILIRPGTDRFLAAAAIKRAIDLGAVEPKIIQAAKNWSRFEKMIVDQSIPEMLSACDLGENDLELLYGYYFNASSCATIVGAGLQRYKFGGENVRFLNALAMVSGNIGRRGGGSYFHLNSLGNFNTDWMKPSRMASRRAFRSPLAGGEIIAADPPVRMIWVNGSNIVNQAPDIRGMRKAFDMVDFKVVVDAFMTDTARCADLFLPSTLMLEQEDIVGSYLHAFIHYVDLVREPPGEARDDHWIFSRVAKRLAPPIDLPDRESCMEISLNSPKGNVTLKDLREQKFVRVDTEIIPFSGLSFDHGDGKYRFPGSLHPESEPPREYPLRLLSLIRRNALHSQILPEKQINAPVVWVAPETLDRLKVNINQKVFLSSPLGRMEVAVKTQEGLYHGVVVYRRGDWMSCGGGVNQLVEAVATDMGSGAAYYHQYVRLEN